VNAFALSGLLTGVSSLAVGLFVLSKGPAKPLNRLWFAFACSVSLWGFGALWISQEQNPSTALLAWRLAYAFGVIWIPVLFFHFVLIFSESKPDRLLPLQYAIGAIFSLFCLFSRGFFAGVRFVFSSFYYTKPGLLFYPYFIWWVGLVVYAHYQIYKKYRSASSIRRNQFKYILLAFVLAYGTGSLAYLPNFGIDVYPYGTFGIMFYPIIVTYAIISYRAMEIQTVIHKTAAWLTASAAVVVPVSGIFYGGHEWIGSLSPISLSLFVGFVGLLLIPYAKIVLPRIDQFFERRKHDLKTVLQDFTREIAELKNPDQLIIRFQEIIASVLYPEKISLILFDIRGEAIKPVQFFALDPQFPVTPHLPFLTELAKNNAIVDRERVSIEPQYDAVKEVARLYFLATDAEVIVPLVHNKKLFGVIHLGQKKNLQSYTEDEIDFLTTLKIEGSIALSNALLYADVQEMSESLRQWANELEARVEERTHQLEESYEKLKELDRLKSRFFANISHEFRTPITLLMGPTEMMLRRELGAITENQEKYLNIIHTHSTRLLRLINTLLNLSKVDAGETKLLLQRENFVQFLRQMVDSIIPIAEQKSVHLIFEGDETIPAFLYDPGKMEEVLLNLLSNALKFTEKGEIRVSCEMQWNNLRVKVSDTGPGIPKEAIPKLFDRFFQVDTAASRVGTGTGIGLSLVKEWVELHKGRVWVESQEGRGSTFFFTIPVRLEEVVDMPGVVERRLESRSNPALSFLEDQVGIGRSEETAWKPVSFREGVDTVLLVDDNPDMLHFMSDQLRNDYNLLFSQDGEEGIRVARMEHPDLIISDIMMPVKDGYQLCRELKADPETATIPIIFLTAKGSISDKIEGLEQGADDYLAKPFNKEELCARAASLLHKARLQKEILEKNGQLAEALERLKRIGRDLAHTDKMASLGLLVAGIAHELNNPVSFAKGSLLLVSDSFDSLIQGDMADPEKFSAIRQDIKESLHVVKSGLTRVEGVIKNLSSFVRGDAEIFGRYDLHAGLDQALGLLRYEGLEGLAVHRAYGEIGPVEAIPGQINQSFLNIFQNAIHAMQGCRDRRLFIETRGVGDAAVVSIRDTGVGIPESHLSRLFEPFFTTKEVGRGTGLGLAIAYKIIVENHHGAIHVNSQVGEGTEFVITLPLKQAATAS
jgi:signal transduction histidine kinase